MSSTKVATNGSASNGTNGTLAKDFNGAADLKKTLKGSPAKVYIGATHKDFNPSSNDSLDGNQ